MTPDARNKFKDLFCSEAEDQLGTLSRTLLLLEEDPHNLEHYATLMRSAHTIKGSSATMGYTEMARLAHLMEDVFRACEKGTLVLSKEAVSTALLATDHLALSLVSIKERDMELPSEAIESTLKVLLEPDTSGTAEKKEETVAPAASPSSVLNKNPISASYVPPTTVRVAVERLDALMGLFEEMLMLRLKLDTILEPVVDISKTIGDPILKQKLFFVQEFKTLFSELARILSETQSELLRVRLVPVEQIFGQFPRMIRDLSLREGKQVAFRVEGGDVELDRTVLEGLGGALAHLLRNAVDHGIVKEGTVTLMAERKNDRVHVTVSDDGAGINYERVREVAIERGIVSKEVGVVLRNNEIADILFNPNMSTNTEVTDISGRGIGLSAVRVFTQDVGGHVSIVSPLSEKGGTRFLLDLPVSLATVKVLIVRASGFTFAVPFTSIVRTFVIVPDTIVRSAHQPTIILNGKTVPLFWLSRLLGITFGDTFRKTVLGQELHAVLLSIEGEEVALVVDTCVGEQELLVKSLPPVLREIQGFSGSTLLPDGRTILLIDTHGLLLRAFGDILENTHADILREMTPAEVS
jgi:two-component system chemotaxis sensor kinase CheA